MGPISGMISGMVHSPSTIVGGNGPPKVQCPEGEVQGRPMAPMGDEYAPEEKQVPSGRYWLSTDEDDRPKVYFDDPDRAADAPEKQDALPAVNDPDQDKGADGTEKKASGDKAESCTCNTDKVDREIEKLKKEQEKLERQIDTETDDTKIKELEKQLAQVERELRQKDNDAYRRQHATSSCS